MVGHEYDMEYLFESSTRYVMSERSKRVRYKVEHEERNSMFTSNHELLCLYLQYINKLIRSFLTIFCRFPTLQRFSTILQKLSTFRKFSQNFQKNTLDRFLNTLEEDP